MFSKTQDAKHVSRNTPADNAGVVEVPARWRPPRPTIANTITRRVRS
jgi:hypothetical protein